MKALLLIVGVVVAVAGGVLTYRALYLEPKSAIVVTETGNVRELPNQARVVGGALMFVGGSAPLYAATRKVK